MEHIKIVFPESIFSYEGLPRNSFMEDQKPNETIPAVGMFLTPSFREDSADEVQAHS